MRISKFLVGVATCVAVVRGQSLPSIAITDGSSPAVASGFDCQPPGITIAANSAGLTMTLTSYFATDSDNANSPAMPVTNRTVFTAGVFTMAGNIGSGSEAIMTNRIGDNFFNAVTGRLESTYFYDSADGEFGDELKQSYAGLCTGETGHFHPVNMRDRDGLMEQNVNYGDTIKLQCGSGTGLPAGAWHMSTNYGDFGRCHGQRVATYHRTLDVFRAYSFVGDTDPLGGDTTLSWRFTTVELTESDMGGGTVTARYHTHAFTLDFSTTAAITIKIDSGAMLTPATMQMTSMDMLRSSATQATIKWKFTSFLQQPIDDADPSQYMHIGIGTTWAPTVNVDSYSVVCGSAPTLISPALPSSSITTLELPTYIQNGLSSAIQSLQYANIYWKQFDWTLTCVFTHIDGTETLSDDLVIGNTLISFPYAIMKTCVTVGFPGCTEVTDTSTRPTLAFTMTTTLPGDDTVQVVLPLKGTLINLNALPASSTSIVQHIDANKGNVITSGSVAWTQAIGFQVALANLQDREFWHLVPQFILITAHSDIASSPPNNNVYDTHQYIHAGAPLGGGWCGLNEGSTLVGAIALSDTGGTGVFLPSGTSNFRAYITTALHDQITSLLDRNKIFYTDLANFAGLGGTIDDQISYVVSASDGSYVVPMRNQLKLQSGVGGGFSVRFCAITHLEPTVSARRHSYRRRRMLATDFTMKMNDGSDADTQTPVPSSNEFANTFFEAQPRIVNSTLNNTLNHTNPDVYHHKSTRSWVIAGTCGTFLIVLSVFVMMAVYLSKPNTRQQRYSDGQQYVQVRGY